MYRTHTCGELTKKHVGGTVTLSGWVHKRRNLGGLIFIDLRDRYGLTQIMVDPAKTSDYAVAEELKYEYVIKVTGEVAARDPKNINSEIATGEVEIVAKNVEVLSKAKTMPFEIFDARKEEEDEDLRLKYRYLELRREKLKNSLLFRAKITKYMRDYMDRNNFVEIATPILTVSSPEGARDFLVPSRLHPGKFYALPQAPQQYKQLLMVGGLDRYYQIAPCMRDEDPRADRSPGEFYQMDCETSFLEQDEFLNLIEPLYIGLAKDVAEKKVLQTPFPRISHHDAMEKYGTDKPDLRFGLEINDITEWANKTGFKVFAEAKKVKVLVVEGGQDFSRQMIDGEFTDKAKRAGAKGLAWMKYNENKLDGTIVKFFKEEELDSLKKQLSLAKNAILFFVADKWEVACKALGEIRNLSADKLNLKDPNVMAFAWIVDFPMFEYDEKNQKIDFGHNPFSMPQGGLEALKTLEPLEVKAFQYDLACNGYELTSGGVRNRDRETMYKAFEIAGYTHDVVDKKFGHMLEAFEYGAPPHCGCAIGLERMVMTLLNEKNIRTVIAFPKNQRAEEVMMGSPSEVSAEQLKELHIGVVGGEI
ncbi:MAG TPA: aspartate--tRNA ligase [Candidatus Magasanikbacteria bacterium]|nr:aspartate--tRNA ligase [Candidatus Magasanikbacteria bacterium]